MVCGRGPSEIVRAFGRMIFAVKMISINPPTSRCTGWLLILCLAALLPATVRAEDAPLDFAHDILPILSDRCYLCHGPDAEARAAGLRLDSFESATAETDSGIHAIVPGDPQASELVRRIVSREDWEQMPPPDSGKTLSAEEIELLTRWVAQGARYKQHWAFEPVKRPEVPVVANEGWVQNPIDRFVLAKLEASGLSPSPPAEPGKLARRIYFDLVGLPPTVQQMRDFAASESPTAVAKLADRLFASPHYGERMAITWLDGARYADSNGYQNDFARHMWPWRDWVIHAFNNNMPYDQFAIEQLAGDLLPGATRSQRVATGFNRNNRTVTEAGSIEEEWLVENVADRVETTSTVFLGLTMGCARCHDHKYDPISQREFFEFYAFFNNITEKGVVVETRGNVAPLIKVPSAEQERQLSELDRQIEELRLKIESDENHSAPGSQIEQLDQLAKTARSAPTGRVILAVDDSQQDRVLSEAERTGNERLQRVDYVESLPGFAAKFQHGGLSYGDIWSPNRKEPFTWSLWVRPTSIGTLVSRMDSSNQWRGFDITLLEGNRLSVHLIHAWPGNALKVISEQPLELDRWSHCTVTYDGSSRAKGIRCYINGQRVKLEVETDSLRDAVDTKEPLRLGQRSNEFYFTGELAEVELFDQALSATQIRKQLASKLAKLLRQQMALPEQSPARRNLAESRELASLLLASNPSPAREQLAELEQQRTAFESKLPTVMVMEERQQRRPTYVLKRGVYDQPDLDQPVEADVPDFLPPLGEGPHDRLSLAKWIVSPDNPLTARVAVNRLWTKFFGRGLVRTPENFGVQAEPPSHPALLDWLAMELIESGWDLQHIQRLIVTSATYQQSSVRTPALQARDANNTLLARGPRVRLPAELIRDNALAASGLLTTTIGGPSVMPYQPEGLWSELAGGAYETYTQDHGEALYRRSLYIYRKRTVPHPTLGTFDAPSWEICQISRSATNTPQQALALLNDVAYLEASRKLAERMLDRPQQPQEQLAWAFEQLTARPATSAELKKLVAVLEKYQLHFAADPAAAKEFIQHGESPRGATNVDDPTLAAYTAVASLMLNLDEVVTKD